MRITAAVQVAFALTLVSAPAASASVQQEVSADRGAASISSLTSQTKAITKSVVLPAGKSEVMVRPDRACGRLSARVRQFGRTLAKDTGGGILRMHVTGNAGRALVHVRQRGVDNPRCTPSVSISTAAQASFAQSATSSGYRVEAESFSSQRGVGTEVCNDTGGGRNIAQVNRGDWTRYSSVPLAGLNRISIRLANGSSTPGSIEVRRDSRTGPILATIATGSTGGWQAWETHSASIPAQNAASAVVLLFRSAYSDDFVNVNWISFGAGADTPAPPSQPGTTPGPTPTPTDTSSPSATPSPTSSPTATASPSPTSTQKPGILPDSFGAVGNGTTDDTAALQKALDSLRTGQTLTLPAGKIYRHTNVLRIRTPGITVNGSGTLLAANEAASAVIIEADNVVLQGVTLRTAQTTTRWEAFEQMKLLLLGHTGITVSGVTVDGSAAAGIYVGGTSNFTLSDVSVRDTRADGIHITSGAHDGRIVRPTVSGSGDDGIAIVSYEADQAIVNTIAVTDARVTDQKWGRAYSIVGGNDITMTNIYSARSACAALYIAAEGEYSTFGVQRVTVDGAQLLGSNQQAATSAAQRPSPNSPVVAQGAVLLYNSQATRQISDVTLRNFVVRDTNPEAYAHVKVLSYDNEIQQRISMSNFAISGGSSAPFSSVGIPANALNRTDWTMNGVRQPDFIGY